MVPQTGVILNDEMDDFSVPNRTNAFGYAPSPANYIFPRKRPMSSSTPVIVEHANRTLYYVLGAAGGSRIITAVIQNLWHVLDHNMSVPEALGMPRWHDQLLPNVAAFEFTFDNATVEFMRSRDHDVVILAEGISSAQAVRVLGNGTFEAGGEPRQVESGGFVV